MFKTYAFRHVIGARLNLREKIYDYYNNWMLLTTKIHTNCNYLRIDITILDPRKCITYCYYYSNYIFIYY